MWLDSTNAMGLEIMGEIVLRNGQISMEMDISNKAMSPMSGFGIQFNKNSFGLGALFVFSKGVRVSEIYKITEVTYAIYPQLSFAPVDW